MISFIIFENDEYLGRLYDKVIQKFLFSTKDIYDIHSYKDYNNATLAKISKLGGVKIFLINVDLPNGKSGYELARKIRLSGDNDSFIILLYNNCKKESVKNLKYIMPLNVIENNSKMPVELSDTIEVAYKIATKHKVLTFSSFDEIYRIPYDDIYYIEKTINEDLITIYTKDDTYEHYMTIKKMNQLLSGDARFYRCSRSCIINILNVESFNCVSNTVLFKNGMTTHMVSRYLKSELTKRLRKEDVYQ